MSANDKPKRRKFEKIEGGYQVHQEVGETVIFTDEDIDLIISMLPDELDEDEES